MKHILLLALVVTACQSKLDNDIGIFEKNMAIKLEVSKETFQRDTDMEVSINVQNKDQVQPVKE